MGKMICHVSVFGLVVLSLKGYVFNPVITHYRLRITVCDGSLQMINPVSCVRRHFVLFLIFFLVVNSR